MLSEGKEQDFDYLGPGLPVGNQEEDVLSTALEVGNFACRNYVSYKQAF